MPDISYHDRLRRARRINNLTQAELANFLECSVTTIKTAEAGTRELSADRLFRWSLVCRVNLEWIASGEGPARRTPLRSHQ